MLTFKDFAVINRRRCESPRGFNHELSSWSLSDWFTAVLGELGEAANVGKKLNRVRDGIPGNTETPDELREQLQDSAARNPFILVNRALRPHPLATPSQAALPALRTER